MFAASNRWSTRRQPFATRKEYLTAVRARSEVAPKVEFLEDWCRDLELLDLGCLDHTLEDASGLGDLWLHGRLSEVAKHAVGLDYSPEGVRGLHERGYDVVEADAQNFDLERTFDVIVAGDLIEHLEDHGGFLRSLDRHMRPDSVLIITTPNPFNIEQAITAVTRNRVSFNAEHVCWLDPSVCWEMIDRSPLQILDFVWVDTRFHIFEEAKGLRGTVLRWLTDQAMARRPMCRRDFALVLVKQQS